MFPFGRPPQENINAAYERLSTAFAEIEKEPFRPFVKDAVRYSFTPDDALIIAEEAKTQPQHLRKLSGGSAQLFNAIWKRYPPPTVADARLSKVDEVCLRITMLGIRAGVPIEDAEVARVEKFVHSWNFPYGVTIVLLACMGLLLALLAFVSFSPLVARGPNAIPFYESAEVIGVVTVILLPLSILLDRWMLKRKKLPSGSIRDPVSVLEVYHQVKSGRDPKELISDTGDLISAAFHPQGNSSLPMSQRPR